MTDRVKVLLDTDIGSDSDDAVCLSYLLHKPECELVGITTVGRESPLRAAITEVFCRRAGQPDIPIAAGAEEPFFDNFYWWGHHVHQATILEQWPARRTYPANQAVDLMRRVIRDNPGEVVLLSVGPMSNLGLLAGVDPEAVAMLKGAYSMVGHMQFPGDELRQECNIMLDPIAGAAAFQRSFPNHRIAGLNVTGGHRLSMDDVAKAFPGEACAPLRSCCGIWADKNASGHVGLHDPLTATLVFHPEFATYRRGRVGVKLVTEDPRGHIEFERDQCGGATYLEPDGEGPHEMADSFASPAMVEEIVRTINPDGVVPEMAAQKT